MHKDKIVLKAYKRAFINFASKIIKKYPPIEYFVDRPDKGREKWTSIVTVIKNLMTKSSKALLKTFIRLFKTHMSVIPWIDFS